MRFELLSLINLETTIISDKSLYKENKVNKK